MRQRVLVKVVLHVEGWHRWPDAPARQAFLRERHRHTFVISAATSVQGLDREIECFDVRDRLVAAMADARLPDGTTEFGTMSCEAIASWLVDRCGLASCCVMEDGLQGASVTAVHEAFDQ